MIRVIEIVEYLQEISENLSGIFKIENSFLWANAELQHRDFV